MGFEKLLVLTFLVAAAHASADSMQIQPVMASSSDDKVNLSVYYESLCPYCANFMVNHLLKIFQTDLINIVNLRLIPWGNTQIQSNDTWICQHGVDECRLDVIEACAINSWPKVEKHFKFIYCVERLHLMDKHTQWQSCYGANNLDQTPVNNCYNNGLGFQLEMAYADETTKLNPRHRFVPWVVVNNIPLQEDFENFIGYVCRAYRGNKVPKACAR
ncbi:gamma-interferon-responsive lysosomal thiol protein-like [Salvia splendens]|uniref:gamma-interferon-responsive lysosomal thiol protein-like n=1 Tax=Salvia splendens TaxID=180675 RepID=UPI001C27B50A|nr:gamma-interferon-responsive lysosomal thiol protein-like [Salvia splendens]